MLPALPETRPITVLPLATRLALVFVGGALGTLLRTVLTSLHRGASASSNTALNEALLILAFNVLGAFALAYLVGSFPSTSPRSVSARLLLGTGLLGGFTSYSALILLTLPAGGAWPLGLVFGVLSFPFGIAAALAGLRLSRSDRARDHGRPVAP